MQRFIHLLCFVQEISPGDRQSPSLPRENFILRFICTSSLLPVRLTRQALPQRDPAGALSPPSPPSIHLPSVHHPSFKIPSAVSSLSVLCLTYLVLGLECASSTPSEATVFQDLLDEAIASQGGLTPLWAGEWGVCSSLLCASP